MDKKLLFMFAFLFLILFSTEVYAATVSCVFKWPQRVVVDTTSYICPYSAPYCNYPQSQNGIDQCCNYNEGTQTYYSCVDASTFGTICTENWQCTPTPAVCYWKYPDHIRDCVDLSNCGTTINKPAITQECGINTTSIIASVQNQTDAHLTQNDQTCAPFAVIFGLVVITAIWKK